MNDVRNAKQGWFWPALFLALGVVGALVAWRFFFQAFPEASIDLRLTKDEIARRSNEFLRGRGFQTGGFRQVTLFDFDDEAKTYLERELGLVEANKVMATRVNLWRWQTRLIKPPDKEEFSVWLNTSGQLVGFQHLVDEKLPGAKLSKVEAQRIAEVFLKAERRLDLGRFKLMADDQKTRPARLDYTFTWEEQGFRLKDATQRMSVTVLGDQVGEFREFLKIPEQWVRDYENLRSRNGLFGVIATVLYVLLLIGAIITVARSIKTTPVPWMALFAISGVVGGLVAIGMWNDFGIQLRSAPTNITYETWAALYALLAVLAGVLTALLLVVVLGAAEPMYREIAPRRISLAHLFSFRGMRTSEFFNSTLIGYGMAGLHIGLVVLFYVIARHFGAWAPLEVKYNNAISTAAPWLYPLSTSVSAATNEEFTFRLLAIPLLLKWTRNKWIAIIVPAFLWGFLHSSYPQQPAWIRGVEVGMIGVLAGWVFLRFGILATLVWHYTVDAVLIGFFLLRSDNLTYKIAGVLAGDAVLVPLVIGGVFWLQSRKFLDDPTLLNESEVATLEPAPASEAARAAAESRVLPFAFLTRGRLVALALAGVLGLAVVAIVHTPHVGDAIEITAGPAAAEKTAVAYLNGRGVDPSRYRRATYLRDEIPGSPAEYLRERMSVPGMARLYAEQIPSVAWRTRFFRPLQKEEYIVFVTPGGRVERHEHLLDEKAKGERLDEPTALTRAEAFLAKHDVPPRVSLSDYRLMEHDVEARDARTDHTLVWEALKPIVGEATHRMTLLIKGAEVTGPRHWVKVPEEWERIHTRFTLFTVLPILLFAGILLAGIGLFARGLSRVTVHWRLHVGLGIAGAVLGLARVVNAVPSWGVNYTTAVPWSTSVAIAVAGSGIMVLFTFIGVAGLAAVAETLLAERFGSFSLWPRPGERGRALLQGLAAGAAAAFLVLGVRTMVHTALDAIPSPVRGLDSGLPGYPVAFLPGLAVLVQTLGNALWVTLLVAALAGLLLRVCRTPIAVAMVLVVCGAALAAGGALSFTQFLKNWVAILANLGLMAALLAVLRFNLAAWITMNVVLLGIGRIAGMWRHDAFRSYALEAAVGLGVLLLLTVVWASREGRDTTAPDHRFQEHASS